MVRRISGRLAFVFAALMALGGCASQGAMTLVPTVVASVPADAIAGRHEIFVATTRGKAQNPNEVYDRQRSAVVGHAKVAITVPKTHKPGSIERRPGKAADPSKYFTATEVTGYPTDKAFEDAVRADLRRTGGRALVFIHGYNTAFDAAVYRMTQIVHDAGYDGTPVLFSWASGGSTVDYVYDSNSASAARDGLEATLRSLVALGARRVDIIGHSMGTWVTMEALRQLAITGDRDLDGRLGDVMLASPDIDVDVFKSQMRRYGKPAKPFVVMQSSDDRALRLSSLIAGNKPRVGDYGEARDLAEYGVVVVDLSGVSAGDSLNHTKFADNPLLIQMIGSQLGRDDRQALGERELTDRINSLASGLGQTLGTAAEIVITTPVDVLRIAVGQ